MIEIRFGATVPFCVLMCKAVHMDRDFPSLQIPQFSKVPLLFMLNEQTSSIYHGNCIGMAALPKLSLGDN
jgi:hypothetical protein